MLKVAKSLGNRLKKSQDTTTSRVKQPKDFENYIQRVEKKAYELYEQSGCQDGNDLGDWFKAEQMVEQEMIEGK
jgi:hypothetical protein